MLKFPSPPPKKNRSTPRSRSQSHNGNVLSLGQLKFQTELQNDRTKTMQPPLHLRGLNMFKVYIDLILVNIVTHWIQEALVHFYSQLVPILTNISSIPYDIDCVVRFEFLHNRARGTCEGVLTVWHVTTICKHVQVHVVRQGHVVIFSCKPRKQQSYVSVLHNYIKHISRAIRIKHSIQPV